SCSSLRWCSGAEAANPLAGKISRICTETSSQPGRTLNDFVHLGFKERYKKYDDYHKAVVKAEDDLVKQRLMLCSDADAYVAARLQDGLDAGVPAPTRTLPPDVPSCSHNGGHGHNKDGDDDGHGHGGHGHH